METNSEKFAEQGYLVVKSALSESDLAPLIATVSEVVDTRATELYNEEDHLRISMKRCLLNVVGMLF